MPEHTLTLAFSTCTVLTQNCTVLSESVITNYNLANVIQEKKETAFALYFYAIL